MKLPSLELLFADKKKLAVAVIIACLVVYADTAFVIGWQMKRVTALKKEIATTRASIDTISRDMALMKQAPQNTKRVKLRGENDIPELLRFISALSADHNIKITQLTPLKSRDAKKTQSQGYLSLTIKLELTAGYHDLGMFLNELERGEHPMIAEELRVSQGTDYMKQRVTLNVRTYVKKQ